MPKKERKWKTRKTWLSAVGYNKNSLLLLKYYQYFSMTTVFFWKKSPTFSWIHPVSWGCRISWLHNRLSIIWKSDLTDKMKRSFFQAAVTSILLYGCTTWTLTKRLEKKLDGNYTRMLRAILNKSWRQHPTRHQLYGHLPPITKTIPVRRTRHAGHCWRSRDELISDVLLWTPTHGRAKAGRPVRTYIQQLCEDTGCCPEDQPKAMNDREEWRERVRDIRATSATWWWWSLQWGRTLSLNGCLDMTLNHIWLWGSSPGALGNMKCVFVAITPWCIPTWSGCTCEGPIYESNQINHLPVCKQTDVELNFSVT